MNSRRSKSSGADKSLPHEEQQAKINEVRRALGPSAADELPSLCSDGSIRRSLRARNWEADKASKMLKETMKWRLEYKPESIRWEDVAREAETGKIYRANYLDKYGRTVLVMRPGFQNTSSTKGQIRYLVYCMENAILNLAADQEQMVWLIDFQGWSMASITIKVTRETAHVLQDYYPERLALGILYNPPRIFESFWKVVKPFLDQKTYKKVKFVYSDDTDSQKIMTDLFDINNLESAFGGRNQVGFDFNKYAEQMKEDDTKMSAIVNSAGSVLSQEPSLASILQQPEPSTSEALSQGSSDSSSPSDAESPKPVHTKNSKENKEKLNLNYDRGSAKLDVQPEPIKMRESA
ncbi:CRAL TRIO domain containing protein [Musa troglodytarum]|uniref:CRAL TRIO domain containing protein n=1 Tax=Musa troglodytarum TaxID=320322 RepID=A0A9E7H5P3_9LILI|nr:CRAL TRIO domain containing protein [Musa troglodytarum]URE24101.1 CRAL TRIO domain containing protein [Musa troglodytarum]